MNARSVVIAIVMLAGLSSGAGPARAEEASLSLDARFGTQGLGLELAKSVTERLNLRLGLNAFNTNPGLDANLAAGGASSLVHFDGQVRLQTAGLLADVYPGHNFHVTG